MDNYKILKFIASGTFGRIYKAHSLSLNQTVAIKKITFAGLNQYDKENIFNEAKITSIIQHPNIIKAIDLFYDKESVFIVYPYYKYRDLKTFLKVNGQLSESKIWKIMGKLISAIHTLHKNNIIHRDIKIQNILVDDNFNIILGDLGIAKILPKYQINTNTQVGTPYYLSPELVNGDKYSKNTDIWSLGIVLYELIYNKYPHTARNLPYLMRKIKMDDINFPQNDISFKLINICKQMLQKNKYSRPSSDMLYNNITLSPYINKITIPNYVQLHFVKYSEHKTMSENIDRIINKMFRPKPIKNPNFIAEISPYNINKIDVGVQVNISTLPDMHNKYKYSSNYPPH